MEGVWCCFFVFNISRLFFGLKHHFFDGPLAIARLRGAPTEARAAPVDAKAAAEEAAEEVAEGFDAAAKEVASTFDAASAELDAVFQTAGLNPDNEVKGALRRALRTL